MSWAALYAMFCLETGWAWEYVDEEMTMPRCEGFVEMWKVAPPLRASIYAIARMLGMPSSTDEADESAPQPSVKPPARGENMGGYLEAFGGAGLRVERKPKNG